MIDRYIVQTQQSPLGERSHLFFVCFKIDLVNDLGMTDIEINVLLLLKQKIKFECCFGFLNCLFDY
jgi:hypothetical protein